jgi:MHS family citrate/tricarballylate:H+ symporter-like MFS transporter
VGGAISDRLGRKPVLITISSLALLTAYPGLLWLVREPSFGAMLTFDLWLSMLFGVYNGTMVAALSEEVPPHVRTTCFSLAYSLAVALFGTFTPLVSTWLIDRTGNQASPGFWLVAAAMVSLIATVIVYHGRKPAAAAH